MSESMQPKKMAAYHVQRGREVRKRNFDEN